MKKVIGWQIAVTVLIWCSFFSVLALLDGSYDGLNMSDSTRTVVTIYVVGVVVSAFWASAVAIAVVKDDPTLSHFCAAVCGLAALLTACDLLSQTRGARKALAGSLAIQFIITFIPIMAFAW